MLADLQHGLAWTLLRAASPADGGGLLAQQLDGLALSPEERRWLEALPDARGFQVTCFIQRWWRETKLRGTLRLTLRALADRCDNLIADYLDQRACGSLFYLPEALSFLEFVGGRQDLPPHVSAMAAFERAYLLCQEARSHERVPAAPPLSLGSEGPTLQQHPAAAVVGFAAEPVSLMARILDRQALPPEGRRRWWVLVAPGLAPLWRPIAAAERALFAAFQAPRPLPDLHQQRRLARRLLAAGALQPVR